MVVTRPVSQAGWGSSSECSEPGLAEEVLREQTSGSICHPMHTHPCLKRGQPLSAEGPHVSKVMAADAGPRELSTPSWPARPPGTTCQQLDLITSLQSEITHQRE